MPTEPLSDEDLEVIADTLIAFHLEEHPEDEDLPEWEQAREFLLDDLHCAHEDVMRKRNAKD